MGRRYLVGVISDTHGLLRPAAIEALTGCDQLIHAGDLGAPGIFEQLARLGPTTAVRGNMDGDAWAERFPETLTLEIGEARIYVLHDLATLDFDPSTRGIHVVVSGHSHRAKIEHRAGVLYLNPGSAGPRRFSLPVSVARLQIGPSGAQAEIVDLSAPSKSSPF